MTATAKNAKKNNRKENVFKFDSGISLEEINNATDELNKSFYNLKLGRQWLESIQMFMASNAVDNEKCMTLYMMLFSDNQLDTLFETLSRAINDVDEASYLLNTLEVIEETKTVAKEEQAV